MRASICRRMFTFFVAALVAAVAALALPSTAEATQAETEKLLYTRTATLGGGAGATGTAGHFSLTQAQLDGKELRVRFAGEVGDGAVRLRFVQLGDPLSTGSRQWLYWADVQPSAVSEQDEHGLRTATFTAEGVRVAWGAAVPLSYVNDRANEGTDVSGWKGAYDRFYLLRPADAAKTATVSRLALVSPGATSHAEHTSVAGKTADQIVQDMGVGWNLGNTLEAYAGNADGALDVIDRGDLEDETFWSNPPAAPELLKFVKDQGFGAVRVPVSWFQHVYDDGRNENDPTSVYHVDEAWLKRVHEVVDLCYDQGLYVIINTHHERLWLETPRFGEDGAHRDELVRRHKAVWSQIADEFADYDQRLVFEGLNEPRASYEPRDKALAEGTVTSDREWGTPTQGDIDTLNALNQAFVSVVRDKGGANARRLLLVNMMSGSTELNISARMVLPTGAGGATDPLLAVTAHPYVPWWFAESNDQWQDHAFVGSARNQIKLEQVLYRMYAAYTSKGIPVVLGEFSSADFGNTDERVAWARRYIDLARGWGMTCFLWDAGGNEASVNVAGYASGYINRWASPISWKNESQRTVAQAIIGRARGTDGAEAVAWRSAVDASAVPAGEPSGRQLNAAEYALEAGKNSALYAVHWSDLERGNVAVAFEGAQVGKAPTLVMRLADGSGYVTLEQPSYVAWNVQATGGVAYFFPDQLSRMWLGKGEWDGKRESLDEMRNICVVASSASGVTIKRVVLTGLPSVSNVDNGSYGEGVGTQLMYTRPVTLERGVDDGRTVPITCRTPGVPGRDIAVRYTKVNAGDPDVKLKLWLKSITPASGKWRSAAATVSPYATVATTDGTGQFVSYFSWGDMEEAWTEKDYVFDQVMPMLASGSGACKLVEVVAVGGEPSVRPQMQDKRYGTAQELIAAITGGYNLAGHFESHYDSGSAARDGGWGKADLNLEMHWSRGTFVTRETIHNLAKLDSNKHINAIRIPVTWYQHLYDQNGDGKAYEIDRAWLARVHQVVDWCLDEDLFVILNIHHENWIDRKDIDTAYNSGADPMKPKLEAAWTQIAHEFDGYDQRLIFEGMNEPHAAGDGTEREWNKPTAADLETVRKLDLDFVQTIRGLATPENRHGERLLMFPGYAGGDSAAAAAFEWVQSQRLNDHLLAASVHSYAPHAWTHYLMNEPLGNDGASNVLTGSYRLAIDQAWEGIRTNFVSKGIPVILGEFGCGYYTEANQLDRLKWMTMFATHAKELGIPLFYWRMDRSENDPDRVLWYHFDEEEQRWAPESTAMIDQWFKVLDDDAVVKGSRTSSAVDEYPVPEGGKELTTSGGSALSGVVLQAGKDASGTDQFRTGTIPMTAADLEGKMIAVRYTGDALRLVLLDAGWSGDWWGVAPLCVRAVDASGAAGEKIAYFSGRDIVRAWSDKGNYQVDDLKRVCVRTEESTATATLSRVALVTEGGVRWSDWEDAGTVSCTEAGVSVRYRLNDGVRDGMKQRLEIAATGHVDDGGVVVKEATLEEEGLLVHTCTVCGAVLKTQAIPRLTAEPEPEPEPEPESETEPVPAPDPEPESEPEPESKPEEDPETEPKPEAEADPETESKPEADPETESKPEADPKPEPKPEADLETESKPESEAETEAKAEPEVEPEPEPEQDLGKDSESVPESGPVPANPSLVPRPEAPTYHIIRQDAEGTWQQGSSADFSFSSDAEFVKFVAVLVDGQVLSERHYMVRAGSTIVTLKRAYLATLAAGDHRLVIRSTDGEAATTLTIAAPGESHDGDEEAGGEPGREPGGGEQLSSTESERFTPAASATKTPALVRVKKAAPLPNTADSSCTMALGVLVLAGALFLRVQKG